MDSPFIVELVDVQFSRVRDAYVVKFVLFDVIERAESHFVISNGLCIGGVCIIGDGVYLILAIILWRRLQWRFWW